MRIGLRSGIAVAILWLALVPVVAQQNPMDNRSVIQPTSEAPPMAGANSFTESQARQLIESRGYAGVSALMNDRHGIWHGTATKAGARVHVYVDYKGNVSAQQE